jgi:hypothetical protein
MTRLLKLRSELGGNNTSGVVANGTSSLGRSMLLVLVSPATKGMGVATYADQRYFTVSVKVVEAVTEELTESLAVKVML